MKTRKYAAPAVKGLIKELEHFTWGEESQCMVIKLDALFLFICFYFYSCCLVSNVILFDSN